ncbi:MAG: hypothetical protein ACRCUH_06105 [Shewanella sp.]
MDIKVFFASMSVPVVVLLIAIILAAFNIYEIHKAEISMKRMRKLLDEMIGRYEK